MQHTPENLAAYAIAEAPRIRALAQQMLVMTTHQYRAYFGDRITDDAIAAARALLNHAIALEHPSLHPKGEPSPSATL